MTRAAVPAALLLVAFSLLLPAQPAAAERDPLTVPPEVTHRPFGPEVTASEDGGPAALAVFDDGGVVAVWRGGDGVRLFARLFDPYLVPLGDAFEVGPVARPPAELPFPPPFPVALSPAVATLPGRAWAVGWSEGATDTEPDTVYLSVYDDDVPRAERSVADDEAGPHVAPRLSRFGSRLALGWTRETSPPAETENGSNSSDPWAVVCDASGAPLTPPVKVNESVEGAQNLVGLVQAFDGKIVVLWEEEVAAFHRTAHTRTLELRDGELLPVAGDLEVNRVESAEVLYLGPEIAKTSYGYLVTWAINEFPDTILRGLGFDENGVEVDFVFERVEGIPGVATHALASDTAGYHALLWLPGSGPIVGADPETAVGDPESDVIGRVLGPGHQFDERGDDRPLPLLAAGSQYAPRIAARPEGGFVALWVSRADPEGPDRVALRRLEAPGCTGLCLADDRFALDVEWNDPASGDSGTGQPVARDDDWGTFWFFDQDNVELAVKVLDGTALNDHHWVFNASLTDVEYALKVRDLWTGAARGYENADGRFASRGDTTALPLPPAWRTAATLPASTAGARTAAPSPLAALAREASLAPCDAGEVCVQGDRFRVDVEWRDFFANQGPGVGAPLTADTAWFWFFRQGNPEMLVKVLDGRPINGRWWVFYAALTNVGFTLRVTDRTSGETLTYENPLGTFASRGDTTAFD